MRTREKRARERERENEIDRQRSAAHEEHKEKGLEGDGELVKIEGKEAGAESAHEAGY